VERDKQGHFIKGNGGGPGRPKRPKEEKYWRILLTSVSADDWRAIVDKAVEQAKRGDAVARKWLADYLVGPPVERKEITGADGKALRIEIVDVDE
jgi:hypothetical protein